MGLGLTNAAIHEIGDDHAGSRSDLISRLLRLLSSSYLICISSDLSYS